MLRISSRARTAIRGIAVAGLTVALVGAPALSASASAPVAAPSAPVVQKTAAAPAKLVPTVKATAKASAIRLGAAVSISGTVSGAGRVPTGRAVVNVNGVARANVAIAWNGTFSATVGNLGAGTYTLAVRYAGSQVYAAKYSAGFRVVVQTLSRTSLTSAVTRITYGDTLAVSAKVAASGVRNPAGRVAFYVAGRGFAAGTLNASVATTTVPVLKPGRYRIDGRYLGSSPVLASVGSRMFDVVRAPSTVNLVLGSTTLEPNARGTLKLSVSGNRIAPTGTATVLVDGVARTSVQLSAGHASVTLPVIAAGTHTVAVRYAGNTYYTGSTSASVRLKVNAPFVNGCNGAARACVDLTNDLAWIQENGKITYGPVPMLSGRPGYRTSTGMFSVYWKDIDHESSIFDSAPMPYSIFFNGGEAFHEGSLSIQSHGCIHLGYSASRYFWDALDYGDAVNVFGYAPY